MRAEELDALLGDPWDTANPVGHAAVIHADERLEMLAEGERLLDRLNVHAESVPAHLGGRLERADHLAAVHRTLWRRDPSLAVGHAFGSFAGSAAVWAAGTQDQRRQTADLLLAGGRIATALREPDEDSAAAGTARRETGRWRLDGRHELVANLAGADAAVLTAGTTESPGRRRFLVSRADLRATGVRDLPRRGSTGLRGVVLGGVELRDCAVPADTLIGDDARPDGTARATQLVLAVLASCTVGPLDTALRCALGFAAGRRLYGATAADIPYVRAVIARAYADLLAADALAAVTLRAVHLSPAAAVYAPAARYLTSRLALDACEDLRSVLGAQGYLREGTYAIFQKMTRDLAAAAVIQLPGTACLPAVLPHLARPAGLHAPQDPPADPRLFRLGGDLPPLDLHRAVPAQPGGDPVIGAIAGREPDGGPVGRFVARFRDELRSLREQSAAVPPRYRVTLAHRYTVLLAAASALAVWEHGGDRPGEPELLGVLDRLAGRLDGGAVLTDAERERTEEHLFAAAAERHRGGAPLDLTARPTPGPGGDR
ncbi:acyl-CoA dehydrogenase family protein [Dactylosporangium sp. NPDC049742]|uniref:acyl-CoA dehydrogenase family protein n=1 Tax=Dactylosporangium sp. NPDC049742 TaxID=3154737 RepID=UPI00343CC7B0